MRSWSELYRKGLMSRIYESRPSSCRHRASKIAMTSLRHAALPNPLPCHALLLANLELGFICEQHCLWRPDPSFSPNWALAVLCEINSKEITRKANIYA